MQILNLNLKQKQNNKNFYTDNITYHEVKNFNYFFVKNQNRI